MPPRKVDLPDDDWTMLRAQLVSKNKRFASSLARERRSPNPRRDLMDQIGRKIARNKRILEALPDPEADR